jgi:hypothetical protein
MTNPARPDLDTELRTYFAPDDEEEDHAELRALMVEAADRIVHLERLLARYVDEVVTSESTALVTFMNDADQAENLRLHKEHGNGHPPSIGPTWTR